MDHRITEWLQLEETLKPIQFQPPSRAELPSPISGCPDPHPTWLWASLQLLWAACASASPLQLGISYDSRFYARVVLGKGTVSAKSTSLITSQAVGPRKISELCDQMLFGKRMKCSVKAEWTAVTYIISFWEALVGHNTDPFWHLHPHCTWFSLKGEQYREINALILLKVWKAERIRGSSWFS